MKTNGGRGTNVRSKKYLNMRTHQQQQENKSNTSNNNNTNNNSNSKSANRYQICLHPVMSATVTAQHSGGATPTIMNSVHTAITTDTTTNPTSLNVNTNNNNNKTSLSPSNTAVAAAAAAITNDTLNLPQKQIISSATITASSSATTPSTTTTSPSNTNISNSFFNNTITNLATLSVASSATALSLSAATETATIATSSFTDAISLTPPTPKTSSMAAAAATTTTTAITTSANMPLTVAQQLTKLTNNNDEQQQQQHHLLHQQLQHNQQHNHHHQLHNESIINNNNQIKCLNDSRKSLNSTAKSFKEIHQHHNNINNNNNNSNNLTNNCNNNHFTELMQRNNNNNNKRLSPTQESSNMSFSSASVAGSIQDDIGDQCGLTKAGLEEYTMRSNSFYDNPVLYHHQKQSSYAQSEGYHSYVSSSDSTSATPMLDRLRQESELLSRQTSSHHWSQNDLSSLASISVAASPTSQLASGRDLNEIGSCTPPQQQQMQQHNNSSESTSSTETLKWLGSMSDVSEVSHATGFSAISESVSTSQLIVHSSRVLTPKRHQSESVLHTTEEQNQLTRANASSISPQHSPSSLQAPLSLTASHSHRHSPSYPPIHQTSHSLYRHQHTHHANSAHKPSKTVIEKASSQTGLTNFETSTQKSNISVTISNSEAVVTISPQSPTVAAPKPNLNPSGCNDFNKGLNNLAESQSQTNIPSRSQGLTRQSSSLNMVTHKSVSASMDSLSDIKHPYRNNHRLFPVSTYTEPVHSNTSHFVHHPKPQYSTGLQKPQKLSQPITTTSPTSSAVSSIASSLSVTGSHGNLHQPKLASPNYPQPSWQSVAALINDFERTNDQQQQQQQIQKYTYLDPNKTHRVPNPALKAFQKNAVQSYFERQQQQNYHHQQQQQQQHNQNLNQSLDNLLPKTYQQQSANIMRPSSLQNPPQEGVQTVLLRNSLPNNYNISTGQRPLSEDKISYSSRSTHALNNKPTSPAPPPPPPRSRSMMPTLLRRSSSASDYAELRDQFISSSPQEKLPAQSIKNISISEKFSFNDCGMPPPPPPPRGRASLPSPRRTSSAADYAAIRDKVLLQQAAALTHQQLHPHQHHQMALMASSYHHAHHPAYPVQHSPQSYPNGLPPPPPPPTSLQDGWVPERPPKNPNLRVPSPELPPPPPGLETETVIPDEPLPPPPPPEILQRQPLMDATTLDLMIKPSSANRRNSFAGASLRKNNFFTRSPSNDSVNVPVVAKGPPPLIPRKPASIELLQVSRPSAASLNQLNSTKIQAELCRATQLNSTSTRKRPHNVAATNSLSSIPAIQETSSLLNESNTRHSPTAASKSSPPPPPLMPRMTNIQQQQQISVITQPKLSSSSSTSASNINSAIFNQKSRCNSKASYLPRQSLEKQTSSDPDHGSYKLTLHSNEDLVTTTKTAYDILTQTTKLPTNLPDVLPLGAKLQPLCNASLNSTPSLRYGSNNNISVNSPTSHQSYTTFGQQQQQQQQKQQAQQQQRYSSPVLNTFNLSSNFTRSQSFDTNVHNALTQSPTKYMTQSSLDLKKPINNLETTIEEPNLLESTILKDNNSSLSSLSSLTESCNSHDERLNAANNSNSTTNGGDTLQNSAIFRAELVNTTFNNNNNASNNNNKKSVTRQESLRENIEKITQLQSQLMSAHITDNAFMASYGSQMLPPSICRKTSQAHVIDIPKSQEPMKIEEEISGSDNEKEILPPAPLTPPPTEEDLQTQTATLFNTNTSSIKSPKILEKDHNADSSLLSKLDCSTDSLKLIQRSEIILRVNTSTVETASQTDDIADSELKSLAEVVNGGKETETPTRITLQPRQRLPIEEDCKQLSQELASMLMPNDALINILCPPGTKTIADYVTNLYNPNVPLRPSKRDVGTSTLTRSHRNKEEQQESTEKLTVELQLSEFEQQMPENCDILKNKMDDLIKNLNNQVNILSKEQSCIEEESAINDELGNCLLNKLNDKIRPIEASKCRTYIADIGHITGLLLSLSERLARAENNLTTVIENHSEKNSLENKRDRLLEQLTEAKRLKEDIDRRGISVVSLLEKNLSTDKFADFEYFINMKAKLITDARDIADKIKMGEELITALSDTLIQSDC